MAVVRSDQLRVDGVHGYFHRKVKFTGSEQNKERRFSCDYPPHVAAALGEKCVYAGELEDAIEAWDEGCKKAREASKTTERVIVAEIHTSGIITRDGEEVFRLGVSEWSDSERQNPRCELKVTIEVGVFDEDVMKLGDVTRYAYRWVESSLPKAVRPDLRTRYDKQRVGHVEHRERYGRSMTDDDRIPSFIRLPWSAESEAWFLGLVTAAEGLILKLNTLRRDRKALQESIDRGRGLLPAAPEGASE